MLRSADGAERPFNIALLAAALPPPAADLVALALPQQHVDGPSTIPLTYKVAIPADRRLSLGTAGDAFEVMAMLSHDRPRRRCLDAHAAPISLRNAFTEQWAWRGDVGAAALHCWEGPPRGWVRVLAGDCRALPADAAQLPAMPELALCHR